jgi:phage-related protein
MSTLDIPQEHIEDAHKLNAEGKVELFEIWPITGGVVHLKNGPEHTYLGDLYESVPVVIQGDKWVADDSTPTPRLSLGGDGYDFAALKGLIFDGLVEGARIIKHEVLLPDLLNDVDIKKTQYFKVKRPESYGRSHITLLLSSFSGAIRQSYPFRQYTPPAFPWVRI